MPGAWSTRPAPGSPTSRPPRPRSCRAAPGGGASTSQLLVDGTEVDWWVDAAGLVHAGTLDGLARGLAYAAGAWELRAALAEVLLEPAALPAVLVDQLFGRRDM